MLIGRLCKCFLIEIQENRITSKILAPAKSANQIEVTEAFFNSIEIPSSFELNSEGEYINIIPIPRPPEPLQPPTIEERLQMAEDTIMYLLMNGGM